MKGWLDVSRLGRSIVTIRAVRGLSLREASRECGVAASTLSRVERGHTPSSEALQKIADWLGVKLVIFPDGQDPQ